LSSGVVFDPEFSIGKAGADREHDQRHKQEPEFSLHLRLSLWNAEASSAHTEVHRI
jgi:hypothetical protein